MFLLEEVIKQLSGKAFKTLIRKSTTGKMRFTMELPLDLSVADIEKAVMAHEKTQQYLEGRTPKKVIVVPGKIVNIVG